MTKIARLRHNTIYFVFVLLVWGELSSVTYRLLVNRFYEWLKIVRSAWSFLQGEIKFLRIEIVLNFFICLIFLVRLTFIGFAFLKIIESQRKIKANNNNKDVLKTFAKFIEKHFCPIFFNKVAGWKPETVRSSHWRCVKLAVLKNFANFTRVSFQ